MFKYLRFLGSGVYFESIELLSKDSIRITAWENGQFHSYNLQAEVENINGEIIDKNLLGFTLLWDKSKQELKYSLALLLGILDRNGISSAEMDYQFCHTNDVNMELHNILLDSNYKKDDTIGIYLLDMIYK